MIYEILNDEGRVINRIVAEPDFVEKHYPGKHRDITPEPEPFVEPAPIIDPVADLKAQVAELITKLADQDLKMEKILAAVKK
jgi:hypothetical protein